VEVGTDIDSREEATEGVGFMDKEEEVSNEKMEVGIDELVDDTGDEGLDTSRELGFDITS